MLTLLIELSLERDRKTWIFGPFNSVHHHRKFEGVNHVEIENLKPIKMDKCIDCVPRWCAEIIICSSFRDFEQLCRCIV